MKGKGEDRHYYDLESEALFFSFFPFIFFFPGSNSCFPSQLGFERHCKKMSVSAPQLVPQSLITYEPPRPDLIRTALIYGGLPGVRLFCQLLGQSALWGAGGGTLFIRSCLRKPRAPPGPTGVPITEDPAPTGSFCAHPQHRALDTLRSETVLSSVSVQTEKPGAFGGEATVDGAKLCMSSFCDVIYAVH